MPGRPGLNLPSTRGDGVQPVAQPAETCSSLKARWSATTSMDFIRIDRNSTHGPPPGEQAMGYGESRGKRMNDVELDDGYQSGAFFDGVTAGQINFPSWLI
jgi:hypothetical protein